MSRYRSIRTDWEEFCPEGNKGPCWELKLEVRYWLDRDFVEPEVYDVLPVILQARQYDQAIDDWGPWEPPSHELEVLWDRYINEHPFTRDHIWQIVEAAVEDERSVA